MHDLDGYVCFHGDLQVHLLLSHYEPSSQNGFAMHCNLAIFFAISAPPFTELKRLDAQDSYVSGFCINSSDIVCNKVLGRSHAELNQWHFPAHFQDVCQRLDT